MPDDKLDDFQKVPDASPRPAVRRSKQAEPEPEPEVVEGAEVDRLSLVDRMHHLKSQLDQQEIEAQAAALAAEAAATAAARKALAAERAAARKALAAEKAGAKKAVAKKAPARKAPAKKAASTAVPAKEAVALPPAFDVVPGLRPPDGKVFRPKEARPTWARLLVSVTVLLLMAAVGLGTAAILEYLPVTWQSSAAVRLLPGEAPTVSPSDRLSGARPTYVKHVAGSTSFVASTAGVPLDDVRSDLRGAARGTDEVVVTARARGAEQAQALAAAGVESLLAYIRAHQETTAPHPGDQLIPLVSQSASHAELTSPTDREAAAAGGVAAAVVLVLTMVVVAARRGGEWQREVLPAAS